MKLSKAARQIERVLMAAFPNCPKKYLPMVQQRYPSCIAIRLVLKRFSGLTFAARETKIFLPIFNLLPEEVRSEVNSIALLAPEEVKDSVANFVFNHPIDRWRSGPTLRFGSDRRPRGDARRRRAVP